MHSLRLTYREPPSERHPMQRFQRESPAVEKSQLLNWDLAGDLALGLFRVIGDREPYEAAVSEVDAVERYRIVPADRESFYVYMEHEQRETDLAVLAAYAPEQALVVPPVEYTGEGIELTLVGESGALQAVVDALPPEFEVEIDSVGRTAGSITPGLPSLPERQREAIAVALAEGYYDVPREGDLAAVAEQLGCAESTASTLLRKAESKLVRRFLKGG